MASETPVKKPYHSKGFAGSLATTAITSKITPLAIIASLLLGIFAVVLLPREEEPQIKVPMIDVMVSQPGASPKEVEQRLTIPMEKLLYELPNVEYIYSTSSEGQSLLVVRFYVGEKMEDAIVRLQEKLTSNFDRIPPGVSRPLVKPHSIDDVPILALTLHSSHSDPYTLRRIAAQLDDEIKNITNVAETKIIGGDRRQLTIHFDPLHLAARGIDATQLIPVIQAANRQSLTGELKSLNKEVQLQTGTFLQSVADVKAIVIGVDKGRPVYLGDVAEVIDGPATPRNYVLHLDKDGSGPQAAVTLSIAKRPGANAVSVTREILARVDTLRSLLLPDDVKIEVTRDYGETAAEKSNELLLHMGIAVFGVAILILIFLGWRESLVILLAVPTTLALTLLIFYLYGYTLNRITLFALIFSIGILVDDAIVVVENIVRHYRLPGNETRTTAELAVEAVAEVGNPTILATWAVIAAILPMAFVGGLMGPYMRPIPIGSSAAMLFSLIIAFTITPWAAIRLIKRHRGKPGNGGTDHDAVPTDWFTRFYHWLMEPLLAHAHWQIAFFVIIIALLLGACAMVLTGTVKVKMLPFDNKSEFQVVIDMPEGSTLEQTARATMEMAEEVRRDPVVTSCQLYIGTAAPYNFNGLVRHYFMRQGPTMADIEVHLPPKGERSLQSHDIARRVRPNLTKIAEKYGATIAVAEVPPGPPVMQTLVAEIYGPDAADRRTLAAKVKDIFQNTEGVVDVDWIQQAPRLREVLTIDAEKAARSGISEEQIVQTLALSVQGISFDLFHLPGEKEDVNMVLELPDALRARVDSLLNISLRPQNDPAAALVSLRELVKVSSVPVAQPLYRKNLKPLIYVTGDVAGSVESPVYAIFAMNRELQKLQTKDFGGSGESEIKLWNLHQPETQIQPAIKWDGEWHITLEVFRDLGIAFAVVMLLIYALMAGWFKSYITPLVVMAAIPFSLIGILPAHWALGAFFTATSMIGFMAGAGIVVRNSIILVDFIELRVAEGYPLAQAVVDAGAIRFRPMLLTALAVVVGASVILADPIFQGLAISLMFGEIASLLISRMAVPVLYFMVNDKRLKRKEIEQ